MNVFLIAGHGGGDSGAVAGGYRESELTREVTELIPAYLSPYANVTVGDTGRDWFTWLKNNRFDFRPFDYVLEIHFNSGANDLEGDGRVTGTEIYVTTSENQITVEQNILMQMEQIGFTNRGVKRKNFSMISKVKAQGVSSALLEVGFLDDRDDMALYQMEKNAVAEAVAAGIIDGFGLNANGLNKSQYDELSQRISLLESKLSEAEMIYNYIDENMPVWARPTIQKLVDKGWLRGNADGELGLSEEMLRIFVVNDRAGLYGQ